MPRKTRTTMTTTTRRPTGRRPVYSSAPGSTTRLLRDALWMRRFQLWTVRVGFVAAWPKTRQTNRQIAFIAR